MAVQNVRIKYSVDKADVTSAKKAVADLADENENLEDSFKKINRSSANATGELKKGLGQIGGLAKSVGVALAAGFAIDSVVSFGKKVIEITGQFQKLQSVLNNTLGKTGGAQAFSLVQQFAAETNFSVLELTESFVKLANQGFTPTKNQLRQLADLANSTGKGFDQLTEAIIDAQTGEFERLKEFGIRAQKEGDKVKFTFKGVQTQTEFTSEAIQKYVLSLGDLEGVAGSTAAISETLTGQISNLGDSFDNLFNVVGSESGSILAGAIKFLKSAVDELAFSLKSIETIRKEDAQTLAAETLQTYEEFTPALREALYANLLAQEEASQDEIKLQKKKVEELRQIALFSNDAQAKYANDYNLNEAKKRLDDLERTKQYVSTKLDVIDNFNQQEIKKAEAVTVKQVGLLEALRAKLKQLRDDQEKAGSAAAITTIGNAIEETEQRIKNLLEGLKPQDTFKDIEAITRNSIVSIDDFTRYTFDENAKAAEERLKGLVDTTVRANASIVYSEEEKAARIEEIQQRSHQVAVDLANALFEFSARGRDRDLEQAQANADSELKRVGDNAQAKEFIQKRLANEEARIKTRQAQADKQQALLNILLGAAPGIVKYTSGLPFTAPLLALLVATTAIQSALVASRPIPKFARGTDRLNGKPGTDTNLIWANTNERIVPSDINMLPEMRNVKNKDLPTYVRLGKMVMNNNNTSNNLPIVSELQGLRGDMKNRPIMQTILGEKELKQFIVNHHRKKEILNNKFSF